MLRAAGAARDFDRFEITTGVILSPKFCFQGSIQRKFALESQTKSTLGETKVAYDFPRPKPSWKNPGGEDPDKEARLLVFAFIRLQVCVRVRVRWFAGSLVVMA